MKPERTAMLITTRLLAVALLCVSLPARAEPSPNEMEEEERIVRRSDRLHDALKEELVEPWLKRRRKVGAVHESTLQGKSPHIYPRELYLLERWAVDLVLFVYGHAKLGELTKREFADTMISHLNDLQQDYYKVMLEMRTRLEKANPGSTGRTFVVRNSSEQGPQDDFIANVRREQMPESRAERKRKAQKKRAAYNNKHPGKQPWVSLTRKELLALPSGELREWSATKGGKKNPSGHLRLAADPDANSHLLLTNGGDASSAGGLKVFWRPGTEEKRTPRDLALAFVDYWTGSFQVASGSTADTIQRRLSQHKVPDDTIIKTPVMPVDTTITRLMLEVAGFNKTQTRRRIQGMKKRAAKQTRRLRPRWAGMIDRTLRRMDRHAEQQPAARTPKRGRERKR